MKKTIVIAVVMSCAVARAFVADVRAYGAKGDGVAPIDQPEKWDVQLER